MNAKKAKLIFPIIILLFFAGFFGLRISADSTPGVDIGRLVESKIIVTEMGKLSINKYKKNNENAFYLIKKNFLSSGISIELIGFEDKIQLCNTKPLEKNLICLVGDVGVHSQNIQIVKIENNNFTSIYIKSKESAEPNFTTDVPSFSFEDQNGDGKIDLVVDQRDYEKDPINMAIRNTYLWEDGKFVFDASENIEYN